MLQGFDGYLYGTTDTAGAYRNGTVFRMSTNGALTTVYAFGAVTNAHGYSVDGANAFWLMQVSDGSFYGTSGGGRRNAGTIFRLSPEGPKMAAFRLLSDIVLTWPTNDAGFTLQSTTNLTAPVVWSTNLPAPGVVNGQYQVTIPLSGSRQFFRLSQ